MMESSQQCETIEVVVLIYRSKNNVAILRALVDSELALTNVQVAQAVWGLPVSMSHRVMVSNVLKRLIKAGYVESFIEDNRHYYEPIEKGIEQNNQWLPILRECRLCGKIAIDRESLTLFKRDRRARHGRANVCLRCASEPARTPLTPKPHSKPSPKKTTPIQPLPPETRELVNKLRRMGRYKPKR